MCKELILAYFNPKKQYFVESDSSNYINTRVLFQISDNILLHLVAYFSKKNGSGLV